MKSKQRSEAFSHARKQYQVTDHDLQAFATLMASQSVWSDQKIHSNSVQTLATRAFKAAEKVLFERAKIVRYRVPNWFDSIEEKGNTHPLKRKNDRLVWVKEFELKPIIDCFFHDRTL